MKKIILVLVLGLMFGGFVGVVRAADCGGWFQPACGSATSLQKNEQESVSSNQRNMEKAVSLPKLQGSLERANIKKRLELFSDENKVSYIYLVSFGKVMSFYTVKGKITSGQKRLTSTQRIVSAPDCGSGNCNLIVESPELDGTYGQSSPYIFFWTTDGVYVQWNGEYMLADQPLKLTTQPELIREIK